MSIVNIIVLIHSRMSALRGLFLAARLEKGTYVSGNGVNLLDYGRHKYEQEKRVRTVRKQRVVAALKELRLSCEISEHDYQIKLLSARGFLQEGNEIQLQIVLRDSGAEQDALAVSVLNRFANDLGELAVWRNDPRLEKKRQEERVTMLISPASAR